MKLFGGFNCNFLLTDDTDGHRCILFFLLTDDTDDTDDSDVFFCSQMAQMTQMILMFFLLSDGTDGHRFYLFKLRFIKRVWNQ